VTKDHRLTFDMEELKNTKVTMEHFVRAVENNPPAYGVAETDLKLSIRGGICDWGAEFSEVRNTLRELVRRVQTSSDTPRLSVLLEGALGSGKSALACKIAHDSGFPFVKLISAESMVDLAERGKCSEIAKVFEAAYKSDLALIVLDNIERLLEYVAIGPRFSNAVLQTLLVLLQRAPSKVGNRLLVIATARQLSVLRELQLDEAFEVILKVPTLSTPEHVKKVFREKAPELKPTEMDRIAAECPLPIAIRQLLTLMDMARDDRQLIDFDRFQTCVRRKIGRVSAVEFGGL